MVTLFAQRLHGSHGRFEIGAGIAFRFFLLQNLAYLAGHCHAVIGIYVDLAHPVLNAVGDFLDVNTNVYENRVMLTGSVETGSQKRRATLLARGIKGVTKVINELQVTGDGTLTETANDLWIETKLKARLVGADGVSSINYRWRSVNGVVYFIGVAQNRGELAKVVRLARDTSHVNKVVTHVRIK